MKILITGSAGMLGTAIQKALKDHILICPRRHELNVSNISQVRQYAAVKPQLIIHLACETDHEYCDLNPAQCYFVNTIGTAFMTTLASDLGIPIIYQSAASVFDGKKGEPYQPCDVPNPVNHYNMSKHSGEQMVRSYKNHIILRSGWLFGGGAGVDKKFVSKIIKKIDGGDKIRVCDDCIGCPTYTEDLAEVYRYVIYNLLEEPGTYNAVNLYEGNGVTRFEYAAEVVKHYGTGTIESCKIADIMDEFPCKRTNYEVLSPGIRMPDWRGSIEEYIHVYRH